MTAFTTPFTDALQITGPDALIPANSIQPSAGPDDSLIGGPGSTNHGICSLSYQGNVFRFRTNPNEIWWDYELITHTEQTYGGRVIQILGTRLGDLTVKVECGQGGWDYMMSVAAYLRNMLSDQRSGNTATFEYTTRSWKMEVYSLSLPFEDQVSATVRELTLQFKIQEDVSGIASQVSMDAALAALQDGIYTPGSSPHNMYTDPNASTIPLLGINPNTNVAKSFFNPNIVNPVDGLGSIPGVGDLGGLVGSIPGLSGFGL